MAELRVRIRNTFILDRDDVLSRVVPRVPMKAVRKALRQEVNFLVNEMCERMMDTPPFHEQYFGHYLCRQGLADPRPGHEPPNWRDVLAQRAETEDA